jgi:hypothetical protein
MGGKKPNPYFGCTWESLADKIAPEVLRAPKTGGEWPAVHERIVRYLTSQVVDQPWGNHAALMAAVLAARRQDVRTVEFAVRSLHVGFSRIFPALGLETVEDWNADSHLPRYLKAEVVPKDSQYTRFQFLRKYTSCSFCSRRWQKPSVRASSVPLSVFLSAFKWDHDHGLSALFAAWYDPDRKRWQTGHD